MIINRSTTNINNIDFKEGAFILVNKPLNWTSFDVVAKIRNLISKKTGTKKIKVGHGGTLDPLATGLTIIGVGGFTKQLQNKQDEHKEYNASLVFGGSTPSYDKETEVNEVYSYEHITKDALELVLKQHFRGDISQIPPIFSAKSVNGKRAYKAARSGEEIELKPQVVTIFESEVQSFSMPEVNIRFVCSKGTYIRSLAHDIGKELNSGAYLSGLHRTKSGSFHVNDSITIEEFEKLLFAN